jgi:cytochrome c oxidase subunit 2
MKSRHLVPLVVIHLVVGALSAAVILGFDWFPAQAAEQAPRVDDLTWFLVFWSWVIFTVVTSFLLYSIWRFRAAPGDESDGPPNHGNTKLEVIWTVLPVLLLVVIGVWAVIVVDRNEALASDREVIEVKAWQFAWEFTYRDAGVASGDLRLPSGRQVELRMRSTDVIHDLFVPEFRVKKDVVPGITTTLIVDPTRPGTYPLICYELCGAGHAVMRARAIVMPAAEYDAWKQQAAAQVRTASAAPAPAASGAGG